MVALQNYDSLLNTTGDVALNPNGPSSYTPNITVHLPLIRPLQSHHPVPLPPYHPSLHPSSPIFPPRPPQFRIPSTPKHLPIAPNMTRYLSPYHARRSSRYSFGDTVQQSIPSDRLEQRVDTSGMRKHPLLRPADPKPNPILNSKLPPPPPYCR